ncbi:ABC transporter substrate-binding protein [Pseudonocardia xishanensis]|uniref:Leucine-binding protein domain-containing protein n=1 Tax=Pseudonocardia xishanensis TaxID=630995 RepID=A0ABP8RUW1_9PSEU
MKRFLVATASCLAITLAAACGSSSTTAGSGSSGDVIKLMVIADLTAPGFSFPQIVTGAQAAVNEVNAAGGIDGHQVQLLSCDSQNDPNSAAACARRAVSEKVSAVVGMQSLQSNGAITVLEKANIASVGGNDIGSLDRTSPISFPLTSTPSVLFSIVPTMPDHDKCARPGVFSVDVPVATEAADTITKYYARKVPNAAPVRVVSVPVAATDVSAQVSALLEGGTDCVFLLDPPTLNLAAVKAIYNSGQKVKISGATPALPPESMKQLGPAAQGVYSTTGFKLPGTNPAADQYSAAMTAVDPPAIQDTNSEGAYAGVKIVASAAKGLPNYESATVLGALNSLKNIDVGVVSPMPSFPADSGISGIPRTFNTYAYSYVFEGDQYRLTTPEPVNVRDQLAELLATG